MNSSQCGHTPGRHLTASASARSHASLPAAGTLTSRPSSAATSALTTAQRNRQPTAAHVIAALALPSAPLADHQPRPFPITKLAQLPRDRSLLYDIGRVDASGRVASREITGALGWQPGDRLDITLTPSAIIIQKSPDGMISVPRKPCIVIPAIARHQCAITAGDNVLLAAAPDHGVVIIHTMSALDSMLSCYHAVSDLRHAP